MTEPNYKHELANAEMTINLLLYLLAQWHEKLGANHLGELNNNTTSILEIAKRDGRI